MDLEYLPYSILLFTTAAVTIVLAYTAWRRRQVPGAWPFILLMLSVAQWSVAYAFELGSSALTAKILWAQIKYLGVVTVPMAWLLYALQYIGRGDWLRPGHLALLAVEPLVTLLFVWTNDLHGLIWSNFQLETTAGFSVKVATRGIWFWVHVLYSYLLLLLGTIFLIRALLRYPHLYRVQTAALLISFSFPWVGNALYIYNLSPIPNLDLAPFAFTLTGLILTWNVFGFRLLDIVPVAREAVIESMRDPVIVLDAQNRIVDFNFAAQHITGHKAYEAIGQPASKILPKLSGWMDHYLPETETHDEIVLPDTEKQHHFDLQVSPLFGKNHRLTGHLLILHEITGQKRAEEVLQKAHHELERRVEERTAELIMTNEQLKQEIAERGRAEEALKKSLMLIGRAKREWESTVDSLPQVFCLLDDQGSILRTNRTVERWNLGQVTSIKGKKIHELFHPVCTDPACAWENFWPQAWKGLKSGQFAEYAFEDKVIERHLYVQVQPIPYKIYEKNEGVASYAGVVVHDITERKRAEKEILALEEQLRQSQKMEAMGRLAGGIAHDFNNLLTPIVGYAQLAMSALAHGDPLQDDLRQIQKSAERASQLIRQMMTFARRQPPKPQVINLNNVLLDMDKMFRRLIGAHIELVTIPTPDLYSVLVDPGQFEQVLVNLVVNARDAMPQGGKLILETTNVTLDQGYAYQHPGMTVGDYVRVTVSDTGFGISPEVKERIFEPFFTTKDTSGGTGLGLSTVYGIVKQSGGFILVYSEPGRGTTFKIYLPRVAGEADPLPQRDEPGCLPLGKEKVLLVEDEPLVLGLGARILRAHGYTVLEASNGSEAMRLARDQATGEIHLLMTDVVMPQMGGKELADCLKSERPNIKVLFTSGYTDNAIIWHGLLNGEVAFLEKPFSPAALVRKVREVLDS